MMRKHQIGLSLISTIIVAGMLGFIAFVGLRTVPVYNEYYTVKKMMKRVVSQEGASAAPEQLRKAFDLSAIASYNFDIHGKDIEVSKEGGKPLLYYSYERVIPLFGNVSLLFKFNVDSR